jgi:hypothetical protein
MASLGIIQWGMSKRESGVGGSLVDFFATLKRRAEASARVPEAQRTGEDRLYIDAWAQCIRLGLNVARQAVTITEQGRTRDATGLEVENLMAAEMARGSLRSYQLVAGAEYLSRSIWGRTVMPRNMARPRQRFGRLLLGSEFSNERGGAVSFIRSGRKVVVAEPTWATTVGAICTTAKARALIVNLMTNRPAWAPVAVWRAITPRETSSPRRGPTAAGLSQPARPAGGSQPIVTPTPTATSTVRSPAERTAELLDRIIAAQARVEAAAPVPAPPPTTSRAPRGRRRRPAAPAGPPAITTANAANGHAMTELQELVWPRARAIDERRLIADLYTSSLELYVFEGQRRYGPAVRAKRLAETELMF